MIIAKEKTHTYMTYNKQQKGKLEWKTIYHIVTCYFTVQAVYVIQTCYDLSINTLRLRLDSSRYIYNLVGFNECLHLWWTSLLYRAAHPRAKCYIVSTPHTQG